MESIEIKNPRKRIVKDLKDRNKDNLNSTAGVYYGNKFNYKRQFQMFDDYKKAFNHLGDKKEEPITISAPTIISSVNAFYGAIDSDRIINASGPGFIFTYPEEYLTKINSKTVFIYDGFLNEEFINRLSKAGVKNVIITSITDYMSPVVKFLGKKLGKIADKDFLDEYIKSGKKLPMGMQFIRLKDFAEVGSKIKESNNAAYEENKIAAYFLTGATTSDKPKGVKIYADGFTKMPIIYDNMWFDFGKGDTNLVLIPLFYETGAVHSMHAGLFSGAINYYQPNYDRFTFGSDLVKSKAKISVVAPSHMATLKNSGLKDGVLSHVKYIFIGGEAIMPAQMADFRQTARRLGIENVLNGYGMTETGSLSGLSSLDPLSDDDVTIIPVPGVKYRVVDPVTREVLPPNHKGILEKSTPCACAGYLDESKNDNLFTNDGWINTDDIAIQYESGRHRVFSRNTDVFTNNGIEYSMVEIEEKVLEHPLINEAEVIKFKVNGNEYPAIVVVIEKEAEQDLTNILADISKTDVPGIEHLIGTKFIDKFSTNKITGKRDYLILSEDTHEYYNFHDQSNNFYRTDIEQGLGIIKTEISETEIKIQIDEEKKLLLNK